MTAAQHQPTAVLLGTGIYLPEPVISNEDLVASFNAHVQEWNAAHQKDIDAGTCVAKKESSAAFIEQASGIKQRHFIERSGILDTQRMRPHLKPRADDALSLAAEFCVRAAESLLAEHSDLKSCIDLTIVSCGNPQRPYPSISIEVQHHFQLPGAAFDMNAACSSTTFGLHMARNAILAGTARAVLVISPEICSAQLDFSDRDSHFIFGDGCVAVLVCNADLIKQHQGFAILDSQIATQYSNTIRCNFGYINRLEDVFTPPFFRQEGRKVMKDVVPWVSGRLIEQCKNLGMSTESISRLWLHQANRYINNMVVSRFWGRDATAAEAPLTLERYGNTSSTGSLMSFHEHHQDLSKDSYGLLVSFGAGYSMGSLLLKKR
ncbi:MAG: beta-ketoacyl-ACP synthase III [Pseudomonadota bacterium]